MRNELTILGLTIHQSPRIDGPSVEATAAMFSRDNILRHTLADSPNCPIQIDALAGEELSGQIIRKIVLVFLTEAVWEFSSQ